MIKMIKKNLEINADSKTLGHPVSKTLVKHNMFSLGPRAWIRTLGPFIKLIKNNKKKETTNSSLSNHHFYIIGDIFINWNQCLLKDMEDNKKE